MKMAKLRKRLRSVRPMVTISMRMPQDVIGDLKKIAPLRGFSGYQPLMRAYIGQGLRRDLELLEERPNLSALLKNLRKRGVSKTVISSAIADSKLTRQTA